TAAARGARSTLSLHDALPIFGGLILLQGLHAPVAAQTAQTPDAEKPVPILSGSAGFLTNVAGGQNQLDTQFNPVLLLPLGERWRSEEHTSELQSRENLVGRLL